MGGKRRMPMSTDSTGILCTNCGYLRELHSTEPPYDMNGPHGFYCVAFSYIPKTGGTDSAKHTPGKEIKSSDYEIINTAIMSLKGCALGFIAEGQERLSTLANEAADNGALALDRMYRQKANMLSALKAAEATLSALIVKHQSADLRDMTLVEIQAAISKAER